ncbi:hypothetical protein E4T47_05941 [Aureobasidium subglaciale]|nr:hypothetical protein E4T47_05941 [Aureobasidium subglaciale]
MVHATVLEYSSRFHQLLHDYRQDLVLQQNPDTVAIRFAMQRWLHVVWPQVFCSIGFIISAVTSNDAARYTATFMMISVYDSFGYILSLGVLYSSLTIL